MQQLKTQLNTIVFGLSGNPPTQNHLLFIQHLLSLKNYDLVRVVLNAQSPLKSPDHYISPEARFELLQTMLKSAQVDLSRCVLERLELERPPPSRMIETLSALSARSKQQDISEKTTLVLGLDALMQFTDWYQWEQYATVCKIKFYPREHLKIAAEDIAQQLVILKKAGIQATLVSREDETLPMVAGSATEARLYYARGMRGRPRGITREVNQLIREHGYYGATS
jgi:nicotinate (nicotinamide) nucleotide adenylyltransferase